jgi:excisionase family DNA binding protein
MARKKMMEDQDVSGPSPGPIIDAKWRGRTSFQVREVAEILNISVWMAYAAARSGDLPAIRIGGRVLIPRVGLEKLLCGAMSGSPPPA